MSNPNALYLLADHIKLSLLERKRAQALGLQSDSQDGHVSRSLEQFRDGLEALRAEQQRLEDAGQATYGVIYIPKRTRQKLTRSRKKNSKAVSLADSLPALQKQHDDLTAQFHGFATPATASTIAHPNDPSLAQDFAHASSTTAASPATKSSPTNNKTVRFSDTNNTNHPLSPSDDPDNAAADAAAAALFNRPYRDDPDAPQGYRDQAAALESNQQVHAYHTQILADQDAQLDRLGASITRQRELSMQIGDELDDHVALLEDQEALVDRHQGRLDRARTSVGKMARTASDNKQMATILVLIVILVLLIVILKT